MLNFRRRTGGTICCSACWCPSSLPVATARPQAVIEEERLTNSTPVPLPDAPGRVTPTPTPETLDIMVDEEAMGDLAERIATPTPAPEMTPEPIYDDPEVDAPFPDDL